MEAISLLVRREAAERMSSAQTQVLAVLTAHPSFRAAFVITPVCIGHECMPNPFRYEALCPNCSFEAALLKARIDESTSGSTLAPHLLDPSCYPDPSELRLGQVIAGDILSGYTTSYSPRMSFIRSTLHNILDFPVRNMIRSWQY